MRLVHEPTSSYTVNRRTLIRLAGVAAYSVPAVSASLRISGQSALATGRDLISAPVNETIEPKDDKPKAVVGQGFDVTDQDNDGFEAVHVDGSASVDAEGPISTFEWSLKGTVVAQTAVATITLPIGTHRLVLTVTDSAGNSDRAKLRIRVKPGPQTSSEPTEEARIPHPPYDVRVEQEKADLIIKWRDQDYTPRPIRIYRVVDDLQIRPIDERKWELLKETPEESEYKDQTWIAETPYLFALRSFDGQVESEWSNVVAFTPHEYVEDAGEIPTEVPVDPPTVGPKPTEPPVELPTEIPPAEVPAEIPTAVTESYESQSEESTESDEG